jgi:hypothetical protein
MNEWKVWLDRAEKALEEAYAKIFRLEVELALLKGRNNVAGPSEKRGD